MKKFFMFLAVFGIMTISANTVFAKQSNPGANAATEVQQSAKTDSAATKADSTKALADSTKTAAATQASDAQNQDVPLREEIKTKFIQGGPGFMSFIVLCLVLGLALAIERIIYLSLAKTNVKKLLLQVEKALADGGIEEAKTVCRNTRGPVASIFYQGLLRYDQGLEAIEKTVVSYGSVQMSLMEDGLSWISLFIALAPSLGFLGTVIGMIEAFDSIQQAGDISPNIVAGGMKVALITTVGGLIVAMILQVFYNYILSRIDRLTIDMEESSISLMDLIVKFERKNK